MSGADDRDDDVDVLAAEYVCGLLDDDERHSAEERLAAEPAFAAAVTRARARFLELDTSARPVAPSAGLWQRIERNLGVSSSVVDLGARRDARLAGARTRASPSPAPARSGFWQGFAAASLLAVIAGGVAWTSLWPKPPRLVIVLLDSQSRPVSVVEAFDGQKVRVVPLGPIEVPAGRTLQVWTLPDPATGPVSMGLMPSVTATMLEGPQLPTPKLDQLYEITLEPLGGSPTGKPTGPIVGKGLAKIPQI